MKTFFEEINGVKTEFIVSAGQSDPIFIFHGNSSSASAFEGLLASDLGRHYRMVAVSLPGHGGSDYFADTNGLLSIAKLGEFTSQVALSFNAERYLIVGQSLGGHALLESLPLHPNALGLCLLSAPPFSKETISKAFLEDPTGGLLFQKELTETEVDRFARAFIYLDSEASVAKLSSDIKRTQGRSRSELGASLLSGMIIDEIQALKASGLPTLILHGDRDLFISPEFYATLAQNDWQVDMQCFTDSGHALHLDKPLALEHALSAFFAKVFAQNNGQGSGQAHFSLEVANAN